MTLEYTLSEEDVKAGLDHGIAELRSKRKRTTWVGVVLFVGVGLPLIIVLASMISIWDRYSDIIGDELAWLFLPMLIAATALFIVARFGFNRLKQEAVTLGGPFPISVELELGSTGLRLNVGDIYTYLPWEELRSVKELAGYVMMTTRIYSVIVIPMNAFNGAGHRAETLQYLNERIAGGLQE